MFVSAREGQLARKRDKREVSDSSNEREMEGAKIVFVQPAEKVCVRKGEEEKKEAEVKRDEDRDREKRDDSKRGTRS